MIHTIKEGDIIKANVDCIVNPANGLGVMYKGVSKAISRAGGPDVENSAKKACFYHGLYKPGEVYWGSSGQMKHYGVKAICHAVIIKRHPEKPIFKNVGTALINSLVLIRDKGYRSCAIPAMGNSPRGMTALDVAKITMIVTESISELDIHIIDINKEFIDSCKKLRGK